MAILTIAELRQFFDPNQVDELTNDTGTPSAGTEQQAIDSGIDLIRANFSKLYTDTELTADNEIKSMVATTAMYYLNRRRGAIDLAIAADYAVVLEKLKNYQEGTLKLGSVSQVLPEAPSGPLNIFNKSGLFDGYTELDGEGDS